MDKKKKHIDLLEEKSELTQEILSRHPSWTIRNGNIILMIVFIGIFSLTYFVKYPDVINSKILLVSNPAPIHLISKESGYIHFFVDDDSRVSKDQLVCLTKSSVDFTELLTLKDTLANHKDNILKLKPSFYFSNLGSMLDSYLGFIESLKAYHLNDSLQPFQKEIFMIDKQIKNHSQLSMILRQKIETRNRQYELLNKDFLRSIKLHQESVIADKDLEEKERELLQLKSLLEDSKLEKHRNDVMLSDLYADRSQLIYSNTKNIQDLKSAVLLKHKELLGAISNWEETFLFKSPFNGIISFPNFKEDNHFISSGEEIATIVPNDKSEIVCRAEIPVYNSGKVKVGQLAKIQLDNFPSDEFGVLTGKVETISIMPRGDLLFATIKLNDRMITSYGRDLPFKNEMSGKAEIITEDINLATRFLYQLIKPFQD
jgi:hypothetical protein